MGILPMAPQRGLKTQCDSSVLDVLSSSFSLRDVLPGAEGVHLGKSIL